MAGPGGNAELNGSLTKAGVKYSTLWVTILPTKSS